MNFPISGAEANYLHGLTHLTMVNGSATLSGDTFTADLLSGQVGPLGGKKGHVVIPNLHIPGTAANISAHVDGAVTDILALIDQKPLGYPTKFGIDPADTKGSASVDLSVIVPTEKDLSVDQVRVAVKADSTKFEIALGSRGRLTGGAIGFVVDNDHLVASGTGLVGGSPLALNWNEDFRSDGGITTRISAKGTLDDAARDALRLNTGSYLKGPILLDATLTGRHGHFEHADATIDLSPTNLAVDLVGIDKPAGTPAGARVLVAFGPESVLRSEDIRITSAAGTILATQTFAADGSLESLVMPTVRFGSANDFSFSLTKSAIGTDVVIRGRSLDGSRIAHEGSGSEPTPGQTPGQANDTKFDGPFHVSAKLDRVALRNNVVVEPFTLEVAGDTDRLDSMSLSGGLGRNTTVTGNITAGAAGRRAVFSTADAGALARGLFGLPGMRGGKLDITANFSSQTGEHAAKEVPDSLR